MFSHLCRCCLTTFSNSSEIVPLFERHKNIWYHRLISSTFRVSLTKDDNLGTNICKSCAIEVLKSYRFRLKYIESERSLLKMINQTEDETNQYEALFDVEVTVDESASILPANVASEAAYFRWKCNKCTASFRSRSQYREHRRLHIHKQIPDVPSKTTVYSVDHSSSNKDGQQKKKIGTKKPKLKHERDQRSETDSFHEPAIVIDDFDSADGDFISSNPPEMNDDCVKSEFRFTDQEPDLDLGLYLIEKHSQISNLDPLDVDNFSDSLLVPIDETTSSQNVKFTNDINSKWKCLLCTASFRTRDLLSEHKHLHMASKRRSKTEVKNLGKAKVKKSPKGKGTKQVADTSVNAPKWQCIMCLLSFPTRELLRMHRREFLMQNDETGRKELQCIGEKQSSKKIRSEHQIDE